VSNFSCYDLCVESTKFQQKKKARFVLLSFFVLFLFWFTL
jgi:hypothetical protein